MTPLAINWSHVWMVTGLGFCMVIALLVVLIFILKLLGAVVSSAVKAPKAEQPKAAAQAPAAQAAPAAAQASADDDLAAIAMALHLYKGSQVCKGYKGGVLRFTPCPHPGCC